MIERALEKLARTFRIEQDIETKNGDLFLVTYSYIGTKIVYTHHMDLDILYQHFRDKLKEEETVESKHPSEC